MAETATVEKKEKTKKVNCAKCNKPLKRVKRYYRNSRYFCNKRCFKASLAKKAEKKEGA